MNGISIIIPAYNSQQTIRECLTAVLNQDWDGKMEVILVNDGSTDKTGEIVTEFKQIVVINIPNGGVSRATNVGIQASHYELIVLVDSDVILEQDWLRNVIPCFSDDKVGAVTGNVLTANTDFIGKLTGYHTELRIDRRPFYVEAAGGANTAYRRQALLDVGFFNENLKVGQDKDLSQRLNSAGYLIILNKKARCKHYWRTKLTSYFRQQYNYAFYHLDIAQKSKRTHNQVSTLGMIIQVPLTFIILIAAILGGILISPWLFWLFLLIPVMNFPDTLVIFKKKREGIVFTLPWLFILRNIAWLLGGVCWVTSLRWMKRSKPS
jgi:cellulose synthase/poly-beta-1,6-N-acetylglucosamine synthase-like glycosyltransferase